MGNLFMVQFWAFLIGMNSFTLGHSLGRGEFSYLTAFVLTMSFVCFFGRVQNLKTNLKGEQDDR